MKRIIVTVERPVDIDPPAFKRVVSIEVDPVEVIERYMYLSEDASLDILLDAYENNRENNKIDMLYSRVGWAISGVSSLIHDFLDLFYKDFDEDGDNEPAFMALQEFVRNRMPAQHPLERVDIRSAKTKEDLFDYIIFASWSAMHYCRFTPSSEEASSEWPVLADLLAGAFGSIVDLGFDLELDPRP